MCAVSLGSCLTICNPMDCDLPGFSVHGILQARIQDWVALSSSRGSSQPGDGTHVSCLLHWRWVLYHWHLLGSPEILFYRNIKNILKEIKTVLAYFSITSSDFLSLITTITSMTTFPNGGRKKKTITRTLQEES